MFYRNTTKNFENVEIRMDKAENAMTDTRYKRICCWYLLFGNELGNAKQGRKKQRNEAQHLNFLVTWLPTDWTSLVVPRTVFYCCLPFEMCALLKCFSSS